MFCKLIRCMACFVNLCVHCAVSRPRVKSQNLHCSAHKCLTDPWTYVHVIEYIRIPDLIPPRVAFLTP